jgi:hypothetical protein
MRTPSSQKCRFDLAPPLANRFILGFPIDYGPLLLLMPFGFHLAVDTLPSEVQQAVAPGQSWLMVWSAASCPWGAIRGVHRRRSMEIDTIGIDLGKTVFHLVGLNASGEVVVRRKFSRPQLLRFTANLRVRRIGMEACGGSHFLGRSLREQGHEVRLMPAQYVSRM